MKKNMICVLVVGFLAFIAACDDSPDNDEILGYSTVYLTADYAEAIYDSDCATFEDTNDDDVCDTAVSFEEDDITISVTSTAYEDLPEGMTASPVKIKQAVIEYIPMDTGSPAVPSRLLNMDVEISAGGSASIIIRIVDADAKFDPSSPLYYGDVISAANGTFKYTVRVTLIGTEIISEYEDEYSILFSLYYYNVVDSGC